MLIILFQPEGIAGILRQIRSGKWLERWTSGEKLPAAGDGVPSSSGQ
jgi:hypothetical protein